MNEAAAPSRRPRGRPAGTMTLRRRQILAACERLSADGQPVTASRLARICGLYDYRDARRILRDLRRMGLASPPSIG